MDNFLPTLCEITYDQKSVWEKKAPLQYRLPKLKTSAKEQAQPYRRSTINLFPVTLIVNQEPITIGRRAPLPLAVSVVADAVMK